MIEQTVKTLLQTNATIDELVDWRIYNGFKSQNITSSCLVITLVSAQRSHSYTQSSGLVIGSLEITCFGETYQAAKTLANEVRKATDGYSGTIDGVEIGYLMLENERALPIVPAEGRATPIVYGVTLDISFMYRETIPTF